ncbi:hypothetical protein [Azospirillum sp. sgz302134]
MTVISAADRLKAEAAIQRPTTRVSAVSESSFSAILADESAPDAQNSAFTVNMLGTSATGGGARVTGLAELTLAAANEADAASACPPPVASDLSGSAAADTGKLCRLENFAGVLKEKTAAFADTLNRRFTLADVDTRIPVQLDVASDGSVTVRGDHPDKAKIERLFAEDKDLANQYREIAGAHAFNAHGKIAIRYEEELDDAKSDKEREKIFRKYERLFQRIEAVSGQMTFSGGDLTSAAEGMAAALTGMPSWAMS